MNPQYNTCIINEKIATLQSKEQHGVVLFIALIALVVLSLAAVALIRSVDTSSIIAGNLAFKQSATISADSGLEAAIDWLGTNPATLNTDNAANAAAGYYATNTLPASVLQQTDPTIAGWAGATWDDSNSAKPTGTGIVNGTDASGNTIRYIIQRMCSVTGLPTADKCLFGPPAGGSSQAVKSAPLAGAIIAGDSPMYRITARVAGPNNTVSYTQAYVY